MPRRHVIIIILVSVVSLACGIRANRYDSALVYLMECIRSEALEDVSQRVLFDGALSGMLGVLDENSSYMPPDQYKQLDTVLKQEFGGIGASFTFKEGSSVPIVTFTVANGPARKGGVLPGDAIIKIDGVSTEKKKQDEIFSALRGELGTTVVLSIQRQPEGAIHDFPLVRARIRMENVEGCFRHTDGSWEYFLPDADFKQVISDEENGKSSDENTGEWDVSKKMSRIAYVRITSFGEHTTSELAQVVKRLKKQGMAGLILDVRGNSGGLLDAAIKMCDMFIRKGVIISVRGRGGAVIDVKNATPNVLVEGVPVAILINQDSASASEVFSACLQDHAALGELKCVCVGVRSYGKGTIQEIIPLGPLPDDYRLKELGNTPEDKRTVWERLKEPPVRGGVRLTVGSYWRPSGVNIHRLKTDTPSDPWGVTPDDGLKVEISRVQQKKLNTFNLQAWNASLPEAQRGMLFTLDPQLTAAFKWVCETMKVKQ